jgi:histidinol-phosphate aminotransferase
VRDAIQAVDIAAYPDRECSQLVELLANLNHISTGEILAGNGTAQLIWLTVRAFLHPGDEVLILDPTFGEYRRAAQAQGALVTGVRARIPHFKPPLAVLMELVQQKKPRLVFICNPNNPSGSLIPREWIAEFLEDIPADTLLVLDEAYMPFIDGQFSRRPYVENCILLRSMTKDFALAGLRLGYAVAPPALLREMRRHQSAWSVNAAAQAAGCAALRELDYYHDTLSKLGNLKEAFFGEIRAAGLPPVNSRTHFTLVRTPVSADKFRLNLLRKGVQVRDCTSFGLPDHIRVSTRLPADNRKLVDALQQTVNNISQE